MAKYDALALTLEANPENVINHLTSEIDLTSAQRINPLYGFQNGASIKRGSLHFANVFWGGEGNEGLTHVRHEGSQAGQTYTSLQNYISTNGIFYKATRMDACEDFIEEGLFDRLAKQMKQFALDNRLKIGTRGDWERGIERTLYIGSRQSEVYVRLYEKGGKHGTDPNWIRYETEVKPQTRDRQVSVAAMNPNEILFMGMSGRMLNHLGWNHLDPVKLESIYQPSDAERSRKAMLKQYKNILVGWKDELGGWSELAEAMQEELETT